MFLNFLLRCPGRHNVLKLKLKCAESVFGFSLKHRLAKRLSYNRPQTDNLLPRRVLEGGRALRVNLYHFPALNSAYLHSFTFVEIESPYKTYVNLFSALTSTSIRRGETVTKQGKGLNELWMA